MKLKEAVKARGWTYHQLALMLVGSGFPKTTSAHVAGWVTGKHRPRKEIRQALERILGLPDGILDQEVEK